MQSKIIDTKDLKRSALQEATKLSVNERRGFLRKGVIAAAGGAIIGAVPSVVYAGLRAENLLLNVPEWQKKWRRGTAEAPYGLPSSYENHMVRRTAPWQTADSISSISFSPLHKLRGIITPNDLMFERHHAGVPEIHPEDYRLMIHGLVQRPLIFTLEDLKRYPSVSRVAFLECPANGAMEWCGTQMESVQFTHGMVNCCEWTGIPLKILLEEVGVKPKGTWLLAEGSDGAAMSRSIPIEKALDDALIVYAQNGEMLRPEQGYPIRLFNPGWEGNTSVKWLRRIEIGDQSWHHREGTSKYTDLFSNGRARQFSWVMETHSVITSPCPEKPLLQKGKHELEGLAWSGRGKIKRVDISFDGGASWHSAKLKGLVLSKSLTRFSLPMEWQGKKPLLLQSRAIDETGYVQPTLAQLREMRGSQFTHHKNAIQTWLVDTNGVVSNAQIA